MNNFLFCCLALLITFSSTPVSAQEVYSWKDNWGRVHYGSNPPANALDRKKLSGVVSRYSSEKLLRMKHQPSATASVGTPKKSARASLSPDTSLDGPGTARLEQRALTVNVDDQGQIIGSQATLHNAGDGMADNLYVAFHFSDGSLVPAVGPQSIEPNTEATFSLPQEMLPLKTETVEGKLPEPELVVHLTNGEFVGVVEAPAAKPESEESAATPAK